MTGSSCRFMRVLGNFMLSASTQCQYRFLPINRHRPILPRRFVALIIIFIIVILIDVSCVRACAGILFGPVRAVRTRAQAQEAREQQQHGCDARRGHGPAGQHDAFRQVQGEYRVHGDHARGHIPR